MSKASDEFEQEIARIHELLEGTEAEVTWNAKVVSPTSKKKRKRQIDVLIKKGGLTTFIECRLHKGKQNVKWIEELIGKRTSLSADVVVGVSANGFTKGAIETANEFGIITKELSNLTKTEVASWTNSIEASIYFYKYKEFRLTLVLEPQDATKFDPVSVTNDFKNTPYLATILNAPATVIDGQNLIQEINRNKTVTFDIAFTINGAVVNGKRIHEFRVRGKAVLDERKLEIPAILTYGEPNIDPKIRDVFIQNFNLGTTKIIHHKDTISILLDISNLDIPNWCQFRYFRVNSSTVKNHESFEIIGAEKMMMKIDKLPLDITFEPIAS